MNNDVRSTRFVSVSQLKEAEGQAIGITEWLKVEQHNIDNFAKASLDEQWIHTDPQIAKVHSPYGTTIAHGFLILSLLPKLIYDVIHIDDALMAFNYGLDKVRFPAAVPVNSRIRGLVDLLKVEAKEEDTLVTFKVVVEIENHEKPACVVEMMVLIINQEKENI